MSAQERVANVLQARLSWPQAEACATDAIAALRADPAAVLSLLPEDVREDIKVCVECATTKRNPVTALQRGIRLLDLLARSEQP